MTVQVNRHFAEIAQQTQMELQADLVRAVEKAFPEKASDAKQLVANATEWMGRNITAVDNPR